MRLIRNRNLEREIMGEDAYLEALAEAAEPARERAEQLAEQARAPWMARKGARRTVELQERDGELVLANTDHGGHLMEYGSKNNPPHAPLRRGVQAAGLRLHE